MRLGRERINHLTNLIVKNLKESDEINFQGEDHDVRINVVRTITNELLIDGRD